MNLVNFSSGDKVMYKGMTGVYWFSRIWTHKNQTRR